MSDTQTDKTVAYAEYEKEQEKRRRIEAEAEDLRRQLKEFGMSATEIKALKQAHDDLMKEKATKGGSEKDFDTEISRREAAIRKEIQKTIDEKEAKLNAAQGRIKELEVVDRVFQIGAGKVNADMHEDFKRIVRERADRADDGSIIFKDENGKPRYAPGSTTALMTPEQFIETLAAQKPSMFTATIKPGTKDEGTKGASTNGNVQYTREYFIGKSEAQINEAIAQGGAEAAKAYLSSGIKL